MAAQALAMGSRAPTEKASAESFDTNYTHRVPLSAVPAERFDRRFKIDWNDDGVMDRLHCDSGNSRVFVRNGKKLSQNIFMWRGPRRKKLPNGSKRIFTGCEVVEFNRGVPSIVVSAAFAHPRDGVRVRSEQFIIHNLGNRVKVRQLRADLGGKNILYRAASRSVKCTEYPRALVRKGYNPGFLCFFAGYDSHTPKGYGTMAALIKLEERRNGDLVAKDLTGSSSLPWYGGVSGTPWGAFPKYKAGSGSTKTDGPHMMGGAFLDYNNDGLPDLFTVGQHASVRQSRMIIDGGRREGLRFATDHLLKAENGNMTEFLNIQAINEFDPSIGRKCLYLTGENNDGRSHGAAVHDHFRCFEQGRWKRHDLPIKNFSSEYLGAAIRKYRGKIYLKVPRFRRVKGKVQKTGEFVFKIRR